MFGVVIWVSPASGTALLWCEDCKDLAVLEPSEVPANDGGGVDVGHLVRVDVCTTGLRRVSRVIENFGAANSSDATMLTTHLRNHAVAREFALSG